MRRRTVTLATLGALLATALVPLAAEAREEHRHRPRCNDLKAIVHFVGLDEEQAAQAKVIYEALRDTVEPLRELVPPLREELEALLDEDAPAPGQVGQLVIDIDAIHDQIREADEAADEELEALLDAEQLERWEEFQSVCRPGPLF